MRLVAVLSLILAPALAALAAPGDAKTEAPKPAERIRKELDKPITIKIDKQQLNVALDMLKDKSKINIIVDNAGIQQALGYTPEQAPFLVDVNLKDAAVRAALRQVLDPYAIIGDAVVVTTHDLAMLRQLRQRVDVNVDKVELAGALRQLARETGVNIILDSQAEKDDGKKLTLKVDDVPVETAVRMLSEMAGLQSVRVGNVLIVTTKEIAADIH